MAPRNPYAQVSKAHRRAATRKPKKTWHVGSEKSVGNWARGEPGSCEMELQECMTANEHVLYINMLMPACEQTISQITQGQEMNQLDQRNVHDIQLPSGCLT